MTIQISPICKKIEDSIKALEKARTGLSNELKEMPPSMKPAITAQIKQLNSQIKKKRSDLKECNKKHPPVATAIIVNPCLDLKKELDKLKRKLEKQIRDAVADLQKELKTAGGSRKQALLAQIARTKSEVRRKSALSKQIAEKEKAYKQCLIENGGLLALEARFEGTAVLTINNPNTKDPFEQDIEIRLHFSDFDRREVTITDFPEISETYDTPIGEVTTVVSLIGQATGTYDRPNKRITLNCSLFFDHSTELAGDSRLDVQLGTTSALTSKGDIELEGSSNFEDGFLDGDSCHVSVKGKIIPHPLS